MLDKILSTYINNLSINNIYTFCENNNISISDNEIKIIYNHITKNWYEILHNPTPIFNTLQKELSPETYNICIDLYNKYYQKYKNYL